MPKARKEYECFECKKTINIGEEYERRMRYETPNDYKFGGTQSGIQKCICLKCISENRYSYIDEKFNKIQTDKSIIKFGSEYGRKWTELANDYMIFIYSKIKDGKHRVEIEREYNRRLLNSLPCEITPLDATQREDKIEQLRQVYIKNENAEYKSLTLHMEKCYKQIAENKTVSYKRMGVDRFFCWYIDNNDNTYIETKTIIALYKRGLLKPIKFTDDLLDFRPTKYEVIEKDIVPKKTKRLTKRAINDWAKENNFGIRENIVWKTTWQDADVIKLGYEFTFATSLDKNRCGYSIYCYGTLNDIKKYNSLELVKIIREEIHKIEKDTNDYAYDLHSEVFKDKYAITDISYSEGYGFGGRIYTPFYEKNVIDFKNSKY
ncbi:hypothetical protein CP985_13485 [Malaciobacter mytili LMG 24559]|uniref:Uncharacterized protein n=1 Tax=Malaciobacter mytili LMG 24559 TaxID=1032238 RepID=A0AAX2ADI1_9BACT|nr:hypothetical protein [Malaciobacter mytili]AXH16497.1 hypothetical protein AMYT_a0199 [Malaciobacter mytili LMG 24559]RXK13001.1 hypothetical protein CP985_13485 [Malaciobacter mytili LMG 24559]